MLQNKKLLRTISISIIIISLIIISGFLLWKMFNGSNGNIENAQEENTTGPTDSEEENITPPASTESATDSNNSENINSSSAANTPSGYLTEAEAMDIALSDAGYTKTEVNELTIILKEQEPTAIYVVSFDTDEKSYEYRINAVDGSSLERDIVEIP